MSKEKLINEIEKSIRNGIFIKKLLCEHDEFFDVNIYNIDFYGGYYLDVIVNCKNKTFDKESLDKDLKLFIKLRKVFIGEQLFTFTGYEVTPYSLNNVKLEFKGFFEKYSAGKRIIDLMIWLKIFMPFTSLPSEFKSDSCKIIEEIPVKRVFEKFRYVCNKEK